MNVVHIAFRPGPLMPAALWVAFWATRLVLKFEDHVGSFIFAMMPLLHFQYIRIIKESRSRWTQNMTIDPQSSSWLRDRVAENTLLLIICGLYSEFVTKEMNSLLEAS